jgi:Na+/H+ antiporter NhaD/arsenite permease-like protein
VVFFIFVVANIGGLLTAIGDPPLFLGYLRGVPFFWTLLNMERMWFLAVGMVIGIFFVVDRRAFGIERLAGEGGAVAGNVEGSAPAYSFEGKINFLILAVVIGGVFLPTPWREIVMMAAAAGSLRLTPADIRKGNGFTFHPIEEVVILFAGIFATMLPALLILKARGAELGVTDPAHFFWATGLLSSLLDNAPTYLVFFSMAQGLGGANQVAGVSAPLLEAISAGAVFMGAITYIGNAPNFMVKAIAEETGIRMPSFFGYLGWSCIVLIPVFALVTLLFF